MKEWELAESSVLLVVIFSVKDCLGMNSLLGVLEEDKMVG